MQKYLIIVGKNPEMAEKIRNALKEAGFATNIPLQAKLISVNTIGDSACDHATDVADIYEYYLGCGVKLLWPEDVLDGRAFDLDGATKVDESHPPKGYRLVSGEEIENNHRPDSALTWCGEWLPSGKWLPSINKPKIWYNTCCKYCIPVGCVLEPKTPKAVKMTMAEINKALGKNIEVIEG